MNIPIGENATTTNVIIEQKNPTTRDQNVSLSTSEPRTMSMVTFNMPYRKIAIKAMSRIVHQSMRRCNLGLCSSHLAFGFRFVCFAAIRRSFVMIRHLQVQRNCTAVFLSGARRMFSSRKAIQISIQR